ncbi:MAG: M20/M25/M40 family metallo-hydrolase [Thermoleophilia bacterium]|nr:M20/M25/M40 family metallo-hydrolase [Thermoleophilia bacterium]
MGHRARAERVHAVSRYRVGREGKPHRKSSEIAKQDPPRNSRASCSDGLACTRTRRRSRLQSPSASEQRGRRAVAVRLPQPAHAQRVHAGIVAPPAVGSRAVPAPDLLLRLLEARGPSGFESEPAAIWREAAATFADVSVDDMGSSVARVRAADAGAPLLAVFGHVDEIGLIVTHADEQGYLSFRGLGGWTPEVLVGQRVEVLSREGPVPGVVQVRRDPSRREEKRAPELNALHVDIGARSREEALAAVRLGDPAVLAPAPVQLLNGRLASRALDNRLGAYIALEAARRVAEAGDARCHVAAVASVQEEVAGDYLGARTSAYALRPALAIAVDVTPATDVPGGDATETGEQRLGGGAALLRGPGADARIFELLREAADAEGIAWAVEVSTGRSHTDADAVVASRAGVPTGVVSVPTRYLHTPGELVDLEDLEACVRVVTAFARRLDPAAWAPPLG